MEITDYQRIAGVVCKQLQRGGLPSYVEFNDLKQAALLRLCEARPQQAQLAYKIAHDAAIDAWRAEDRHWEGPTWQRADISDAEDGEAPGPPEVAADTTEPPDFSGIHDAINRLPDRQASAIRLVFLEGMSESEAAEEMRTTVDAIKQLVARAKKKLAKFPELLIFLRPSQRAALAQ